MERELWCLIVATLRRLPRRRHAQLTYSDPQILAVLFWAALHDRSINWACQRNHWPGQAWRRLLPNQSTMSRRLRDPSTIQLIQQVLDRLQVVHHIPTRLILDGKPLSLRSHTGDPDATYGWADGGKRRGYKLHLVIDDQQCVRQWIVKPMHESEPVVAREDLVPALGQTPTLNGLPVLADANYDRNPLYAATADAGLVLLAPRQRPGTELGHRTHHPDRLTSMYFLEHCSGLRKHLFVMRGDIERFFGRDGQLRGVA
ncbi:MAG: transposase [Planctomycetes bacterium]|nr:transposase [Planctomycetota bacterium]